jgi:uncharacterized protein (DUF1919 family)
MQLAQIHTAACDRVNPLLLRAGASRDFAIVSNNCWGAGFYRDLGREYNTPFVGTMLPPACYLKLLAGFPESLHQPLRFIPKSRYTSWEIRCPVAELGDSEIHFMHYASQTEAAEKWRRRLDRFSRDPAAWRFKFCDHHVGPAPEAEELFARFDALPLSNKVCFLGRREPSLACGIVLPECLSDGRVMDGHALYRPSLRHFNARAWLAGAHPQPSRVPGLCL